ncbi:LOW QUALITY PROTEIN: hypothetical protein HJC23_005491 [Cyclotella cryptica]|uniref:Uncharacterized protein n=1 Tax=Cyclotella cryptica TaxID=29204 RepID=A0ABD3PFR2_9STRA
MILRSPSASRSDRPSQKNTNHTIGKSMTSCHVIPSSNPREDARLIRFLSADRFGDSASSNNHGGSSDMASEVVELQFWHTTKNHDSVGRDTSKINRGHDVVGVEPIRIMFVSSGATFQSDSQQIPHAIFILPDIEMIQHRADTMSIQCIQSTNDTFKVQLPGGGIIAFVAKSLWETTNGYTSVMNTAFVHSPKARAKISPYSTKERTSCNDMRVEKRRDLSTKIRDSLTRSRHKRDAITSSNKCDSDSRIPFSPKQTGDLADLVPNDTLQLHTNEEVSIVLENETSPMAEIAKVSSANLSSLEANFISESPHYIPNSNNLQTMHINSREGIDFETDFFVGKAMLLVRPPPANAVDANTDTTYTPEIFTRKKRTIQVQFQGKFKRLNPHGILYCGGEITEPMKLGIVTRGLCNMLLKMLSKFNSGLHYSFGSDDANAEYPHIVFPAWTFFDRIVVSKPGEEIPRLGEEFVESETSQRERRNATLEDCCGVWNTTDTFSMSFHNMYLDLGTWQLVNLPIARDMDLGMFWGEGMLRLIMYEVGLGDVQKGRHTTESLVYYLGVQINYSGGDSKGDDENSGDVVTEAKAGIIASAIPWKKTRPSMRRITSYSEICVQNSFAEDGSNIVTQPRPTIVLTKSLKARTMEWKMKIFRITVYFDAEQDLRTDRQSYLELETLRHDEFVNVDNLCPGWVYHWRGKSKSNPNQYAVYFAVAITSSSKTRTPGGENTRNKSDRIIFRDLGTVSGEIKRRDRNKDMYISPRASSLEKKRRILGSMILKDGTVRSRLLGSTHCDKTFLKRSPDTFMHQTVRAASIAWECIARARSERHWVEELVVLTGTHISFYSPGARYPLYRITNESVTNVAVLDPKQSPHFPGFCFMSIELLGRTTYLMFLDANRRDHFIHSVINVLSSCRTKDEASNDVGLILRDDPAEEFLHKSSKWKCRQRRIMNCQRLAFRAKAGSSRHPCDMINDTLRLALGLKDRMTCDSMLSFLHAAADLKSISVRHLTDSEKIPEIFSIFYQPLSRDDTACFLHSWTPSTSVVRWANYFNLASYQCCDDVFSIVELEHCIIRNSPPSHISKFTLPKSKYPFSLNQSDFRLNFALNCGSYSNPACILLYNSEKLDEQLNMATKIYLESSVKISEDDKRCQVLLPRVVNWFSDDFETSLEL